jgi:F-type H+-transporting ATPase subunit a
MAETAHSTVHTGEVHEAHELPNFVTLLHGRFPDNSAISFLNQYQNNFFSVFAALLLCFILIRAARSKTLVPQGLRNFIEAIMEAIANFVIGILGEKHGPKHIPFLGTLFFYILLMNWGGLLPFWKSPTAAWSITFPLGLITILYVQITGIREQGLWNYFKHIAGNPATVVSFVLLPLMLPLNIFLEVLAVPFSLSLRLFANISSEDRLLLKFAELNTFFDYKPFVFQLFANILVIVFSVIQAFVFMLLTTVYIALILPHDDQHGHAEQSANAQHAH